jgi:class I fructose-bisphosphate aldolase
MKKELEKNIQKLLTNGKTFMLAYDQGLEHGPSDFTDENANPEFILEIARKAKVNAIILQKGIAEKYYNPKKDVPLVLKLNGKTNLFQGEPISKQLCSVKEALELGAKAVGYTIYLGSSHEAEMLQEFGKIEEEAHEHNLPIIAWMYPRGSAIKEITPEIIAYAARVGLEIGADFVKINYTGNVATFSNVIKEAGKCKVLALGGAKKGDAQFLEEVKKIMLAGATGMAIGRNIWQNKDPVHMAKTVKKLITGKTK